MSENIDIVTLVFDFGLPKFHLSLITYSQYSNIKACCEDNGVSFDELRYVVPGVMTKEEFDNLPDYEA